MRMAMDFRIPIWDFRIEEGGIEMAATRRRRRKKGLELAFEAGWGGGKRTEVGVVGGWTTESQWVAAGEGAEEAEGCEEAEVNETEDCPGENGEERVQEGVEGALKGRVVTRREPGEGGEEDCEDKEREGNGVVETPEEKAGAGDGDGGLEAGASDGSRGHGESPGMSRGG